MSFFSVGVCSLPHSLGKLHSLKSVSQSGSLVPCPLSDMYTLFVNYYYTRIRVSEIARHESNTTLETPDFITFIIMFRKNMPNNLHNQYAPINSENIEGNSDRPRGNRHFLPNHTVKVATALAVGAAGFTAAHRYNSGPTDTHSLPECTPLRLRNIAMNNGHNAGTLHTYPGHSAISASYTDDNGNSMYIVDDIYMGPTFKACHDQPRANHDRALNIRIPGDPESLYKSIEAEQKTNTRYWPGNTCADRASRIIDRHLGCQLNPDSTHNIGDLYPAIGRFIPGQTPMNVAREVVKQLDKAGIETDSRRAPELTEEQAMNLKAREAGHIIMSSMSSAKSSVLSARRG